MHGDRYSYVLSKYTILYGKTSSTLLRNRQKWHYMYATPGRSGQARPRCIIHHTCIGTIVKYSVLYTDMYMW